MSNNADEKRSTSLEELKEYAKGALIDLPDFGPGQPFKAYVKRPSMLKLVQSGKINNALLATAQELFTGSKKPMTRDEQGSLLRETSAICDIFAEECLVSPSYKEIQEAGIDLADDQLIALFNYAQHGVKALIPFRQEQKNPTGDIPVKNVQPSPQRNPGDKQRR